ALVRRECDEVGELDDLAVPGGERGVDPQRSVEQQSVVGAQPTPAGELVADAGELVVAEGLLVLGLLVGHQNAALARVIALELEGDAAVEEGVRPAERRLAGPLGEQRSEEHTSEL